MFAISSIVQKAQQLIDPIQGLKSSTGEWNPSNAALFQSQFRLPASQSPLYEISAELTIPPSSDTGEKDDDRGFHYSGKLHLSEAYLCFSTSTVSFLSTAGTPTSPAPESQRHGSGPSGNGFTFPLCSIRKVERLNSQSVQFTLVLTTWNASTHDNAKVGDSKSERKDIKEQRILIHLAGARHTCERFCDGLKKGLRAGVANTSRMKSVVAECYSEYLLRPEEKRTAVPPDAGLGILFKYPGDAKKLRDRSKMRLWGEYLRDNGRNMTLIRQPTFHKLIRVGLPNRLRGEIWELTSGSLYLRLENPILYADTLAKFSGKESLAIDEIEKDLNRSLPEYPGFQSEDGIGRLRRVLTAYSWVNTDVGYCQAMNIVVAALLIYMSEAQAFFLLSTLCDRFIPGYYSTTMYGTLLDQKVFESLVEKTMPILWDHLTKHDIQLSVVSLPWFLSLYINSMPLVFAFRVLDVFFIEGPKVLFQIGLAILRINGEELLDATDDGAVISVLKSYFSRLDESAHPKSENPKLRSVIRFQELLVVAFREFSAVTHNSITDLRMKNKSAVLDNIENFAKRTAIRNLGPDSKLFRPAELGELYDRFYGVLYERQQRSRILQEEQRRKATSRLHAVERDQDQHQAVSDFEKGRVGLGPSTGLMDYDAFRDFLAGMAKWALTDLPAIPRRDTFTDKQKNSLFDLLRSPVPNWPEPADHEFMERLFKKWDVDCRASLTLQNVVSGLARVRGKDDVMGTLSYFFELYSDENDGKVDREGILRMSEALLFLSRRGLDGSLGTSALTPVVPEADLNSKRASTHLTLGSVSTNDKFLDSVSAFIRRCFEYADPEFDEASMSDSTFSIGGDNEDDDQEDLIQMDSSPRGSPKPAEKPKRTASNSGDTNSGVRGHDVEAESRRRVSRAKSEAANAALNPANPLYITLPTFRMVALADELLEQFFESSFPASFHILAEANHESPSASNSLTTFSSLGFGNSRPIAPGGSRGLRGVLDNIVTDGMRVAAEVRRRMEEAQREAAAQNNHEDEDDEDDGTSFGASPRFGSSARRGTAGSGMTDFDRRSVKSTDRDLLDGADAEAGALGADLDDVVRPRSTTVSGDSVVNGRLPDDGTAMSGIVEFEGQ